MGIIHSTSHSVFNATAFTMASLVLEVPKEYGYVLAVASATGFVNLLHFFTTAKYRKASGVAYPAPYATEEQCKDNAMAVKFNCAQRAHSNFGENIISFLPALAISGLTYPWLLPFSALLGFSAVSSTFWATPPRVQRVVACKCRPM